MPDVPVGCATCGAVAVFDGVVGRGARCQSCGADLRCCNNCRFYDASAYNECGEPVAERVVEKDRANFCDYFSPSGGAAGPRASRPAGAGSASASAPHAPADALESLFRKR
ncbi:MAG: hypothetical protein HY899_01165 [Deltaproteobacteria bacterium]|nr:hypothetical protein [Deltaproteobacteria bacterium]